jgi:hypothetical protein
MTERLSSPRRLFRDRVTGAARNPAIRELESRACRRCGAEPGRQCVTSSGGLLNHPHAARQEAALQAAPPDTLPVVESYRARRRESDSAEGAASRRIRNSRIVFAHYGTECACCGVTEELTIDHVDGEGAAHREELGNRGGGPFFKWLIRNGLPPGFQTLCSPCNRNKGTGARCHLPHGQMQECPTCRRPLEESEAASGRRRRRITLQIMGAEMERLEAERDGLRTEVERLTGLLGAGRSDAPAA